MSLHHHSHLFAETDLYPEDIVVSPSQNDTKIYDKKTVGILKQNPFSTKFTTPGKIPYYFPVDYQNRVKHEALKFEHYFFRSLVESDHLWTNICLLYLIDQLEEVHRFAQIVGPHGSGKSTLIASLKDVLLRKGYRLLDQSLHDGQKKLPKQFWAELAEFGHSKTPQKVLIVDGYEQLSIFQRLLLQYRCRGGEILFLITTHRPVFRVPVLYQTETSRETLDKIVDYLLEVPTPFVNENVISQLMKKHRHNTREILFSLYDLYEECRWKHKE